MGKKRGSQPAAPQLPAQSPAPELMDVIDTISGVETITVTGADGKKRRITQKLPPTREEKEIFDQAEALIKTAVDNIQALYRHDPATAVNYQPFIQAFSNINNERMADLAQMGDFKDIAEKVNQFKTINSELTMRAFDENQRMSEETLARRGLSNSSQATQLRAAMAKERALLAQQVEVSSAEFGEELRDRQVAREANLYGLKDLGREARLSEAEVGYNLERQKEDDLRAIRQDAINENLGAMELGRSITGSKEEKSRLALAQNQIATSQYGTEGSVNNARDTIAQNRTVNQFNMDSTVAARRPASFGRRLLDVGMAEAGQFAGSTLRSGLNRVTSSPEPTVVPSFGGSSGRNKAFGALQRLRG